MSWALIGSHAWALGGAPAEVRLYERGGTGPARDLAVTDFREQRGDAGGDGITAWRRVSQVTLSIRDVDRALIECIEGGDDTKFRLDVLEGGVLTFRGNILCGTFQPRLDEENPAIRLVAYDGLSLLDERPLDLQGYYTLPDAIRALLAPLGHELDVYVLMDWEHAGRSLSVEPARAVRHRIESLVAHLNEEARTYGAALKALTELYNAELVQDYAPGAAAGRAAWWWMQRSARARQLGAVTVSRQRAAGAAAPAETLNLVTISPPVVRANATEPRLVPPRRYTSSNALVLDGILDPDFKEWRPAGGVTDGQLVRWQTVGMAPVVDPDPYIEDYLPRAQVPAFMPEVGGQWGLNFEQDHQRAKQHATLVAQAGDSVNVEVFGVFDKLDGSSATWTLRPRMAMLEAVRLDGSTRYLNIYGEWVPYEEYLFGRLVGEQYFGPIEGHLQVESQPLDEPATVRLTLWFDRDSATNDGSYDGEEIGMQDGIIDFKRFICLRATFGLVRKDGDPPEVVEHRVETGWNGATREQQDGFAQGDRIEDLNHLVGLVEYRASSGWRPAVGAWQDPVTLGTTWLHHLRVLDLIRQHYAILRGLDVRIHPTAPRLSMAHLVWRERTGGGQADYYAPRYLERSRTGAWRLVAYPATYAPLMPDGEEIFETGGIKQPPGGGLGTPVLSLMRRRLGAAETTLEAQRTRIEHLVRDGALARLTEHLSGVAWERVLHDDMGADQGPAYVTAGPIGPSGWGALRSGLDWGARIHGHVLELTNSAGGGVRQPGWVFVHRDMGSIPDYSPQLEEAEGPVRWSVNMRQPRANPAGFAVGQYGVAFVLAASHPNVATEGVGYAIVLGNEGQPDPVRLVRFDGGLQSIGASEEGLIVSGAPLHNPTTDFISVSVVYDPATHTWRLFGRNDASIFQDPEEGALEFLGSATDDEHVDVALPHLGAYWQGSTVADQVALFDNVSVSVADASQSVMTAALPVTPTVAALSGGDRLSIVSGGGHAEVVVVGDHPAGATEIQIQPAALDAEEGDAVVVADLWMAEQVAMLETRVSSKISRQQADGLYRSKTLPVPPEDVGGLVAALENRPVGFIYSERKLYAVYALAGGPEEALVLELGALAEKDRVEEADLAEEITDIIEDVQERTRGVNTADPSAPLPDVARLRGSAGARVNAGSGNAEVIGERVLYYARRVFGGTVRGVLEAYDLTSLRHSVDPEIAGKQDARLVITSVQRDEEPAPTGRGDLWIDLEVLDAAGVDRGHLLRADRNGKLTIYAKEEEFGAEPIIEIGSGGVHLLAPLAAHSTASLVNLPTSDPGVAGQLWRDGTTVKVSTGAGVGVG